MHKQALIGGIIAPGHTLKLKVSITGNQVNQKKPLTGPPGNGICSSLSVPSWSRAFPVVLFGSGIRRSHVFSPESVSAVRFRGTAANCRL